MAKFVLLDSERLGVASRPIEKPDAARCLGWIAGLRGAGTVVVIPEIVRYEVRRELIRSNKDAGLKRLDELASDFAYLHLTPYALDYAAQLWADVRKQGLATAPDHALDVDAILAAQALTMAMAGIGDEVLVATSNKRHLNRFAGVDAREWQMIT